MSTQSENARRFSSHPEKLLYGKKVAVIGGGPAGAFAAYLLAKSGVAVDILEPRDTRIPMITQGDKIPPCTGCAGWVQNDVFELLKASGLEIPKDIIQEEIHNVAIHLARDGTEINLHLNGSTGTLFRGFGPINALDGSRKSFDAFLLDSAIQVGAHLNQVMIKEVDLRKHNELVNLIATDGSTHQADMVIGAFGHNPKLMKHIKYPEGFQEMELPVTQRASVREHYLGEQVVSERLQQKIHILGNPAKNIWFSAIVPKYDYVSVVVIGRNDIRPEDFNEFFDNPQVKQLLGDATNKEKPHCACLSTVTLHSPKRYVVSDAENNIVMVNIGDAGPTRPRDNGIYAALNSAKQLTDALTMYGNSPSAFHSYRRFIHQTYIEDNFWVDRTLEIIDLVLNHRLPRKTVTYLATHHIPFFSSAVLEAIRSVVTGSASYKSIPYKMVQAGLRNN